MSYFYHLTALAAVFLYLVLLRRLISNAYRDYTILFLYVCILLLTTATDYAFVFKPRPNPFKIDPLILYYIDDFIRQLMVYVIVISLIYRALPGDLRARGFGRWLILAAVAMAAVFVMLLRDPRISRWMTSVVRNLSFLAMFLNLGLWLLLIRRRSRDRRLLALTSGLGLQMAGEAIGQSIRLLGARFVDFGNVVLVVSHVLCLVVWAHAFGPPPKRRLGPAGSIQP